jgi:polar amino acid transport system substrate-binding protein
VEERHSNFALDYFGVEFPFPWHSDAALLEQQRRPDMGSNATLSRRVVLAGLAALSARQAGAQQPQDTLAAIRARGKLIVGVKTDYRPYGFVDPSGQIVGLEVDLAREVAQRIGVGLELVPVIASNRMEFLRQGRIDMILATMSDTPERRRVVGMVEPNYYADGVTVLAPKSAGLKSWEQLRGRRVCAIQGAYSNRRVTQLYGPELQAFPAVPDALNALLGGNCIAFFFDHALIVSTLASDPGKWSDYEMPLPSEDQQPWAIGIRLEDVSAPFGKLLSEISTEWLHSGHILELESKWGVAPSPYLVEMRRKLSGG